MPRKTIKRHPAAVAQDAWEATEEYQRAEDPSTLGPNGRPYLRNRLHLAFQAGYAAAERQLSKKKEKPMSTITDPGSRAFGAWCFDHGVRVDWIIPLMAASDGESASDCLQSFVEDETIADICTILGVERPEWLTDDHAPDEVLDFIGAHLLLEGYLVRFESQVHRNFRAGSSSTSGWGHCHVATIYAPTFAEIVPKVQAEAARLLEKDRNYKPKKVKVSK